MAPWIPTHLFSSCTVLFVLFISYNNKSDTRLVYPFIIYKSKHYTFEKLHGPNQTCSPTGEVNTQPT